MPSKITTAILLAAGEGTRLRPLTLTRPKHLIPILNRPFIFHLLANLESAGIKRAVLVIGYKDSAIVSAIEEFRKGSALKIEFVRQEKPEGTGQAFAVAKPLIREERFLVLAGDNYYTAEDLSAFLKTAEKTDSYLAGGIPVEEPSRFGIFALAGEKVTGVAEKPQKPQSNLANSSLYLMDQACFGLAAKLTRSPRGEYEITDVLKILAGRNLLSFHRLTYWTDLGNPWDILELSGKLLEGIKGKIDKGAVVEEGATLKGAVVVGKGTTIRAGSYVEGPVLIGEDCEIGPNCFIRPGTVLGSKTGIGQAVELKNTIVFGSTNIKHLSYAADSIIGENCNLGAGTITANLRHDKRTVKMELNGKVVDSRRKKLGAVIADNSKTGIHCSILPGRTIGPNSWTDSGSVVERNVPPGKLLKRDGTLVDLPK